MARLPQLAVFSFAAFHLLFFSICPISGRIYRTNDAVVIEVDGVTPSILANRNSGIPAPIPMMYAVNPYTGLSYQQQPSFAFWPYPLYKPTSSFSDVENVTATIPEYRQNIPCGVGPAKLPKSNTPEERIFGGAPTGSWPFMVGLKRSTDFGVFCGGSILTPTKILTAASCVEKMSLKDISTLLVLVGMGTQGDDKKEQSNPQFTKTVTRVVYHIDYSAITKQNDIAILTIDPPMTYSKTVSPVCLPPASTAADQFVDKGAAIMGWGRVDQVGTRATQLLHARLNIWAIDDCKEAWADRSDLLSISTQQLCASADGKALCADDKGGPLVAQLNAGSTSWTQVGIASFNAECIGIPSFPSVYNSVAFFRKWIDANLMA